MLLLDCMFDHNLTGSFSLIIVHSALILVERKVATNGGFIYFLKTDVYIINCNLELLIISLCSVVTVVNCSSRRNIC